LRKLRQQSLERAGFECDATGCRLKSGSSNVDENRTAATGDARARVVVKFDNEIVKTIVAPQPVRLAVGG
jgi:hypothetical protein